MNIQRQDGRTRRVTVVAATIVIALIMASIPGTLAVAGVGSKTEAKTPNWFQEETVPTANGAFKAVDGVGNTAWAVGTGGKIYKTGEAGKWYRQDSGTALNLNGVSAAGYEDVWAVGALGTILHTMDGGQTWRREGSGVTDENLYAVFALDWVNAWAVGDQGVVLHTHDCGQTWIPKNVGNGVHLTGVSAQRENSADEPQVYAVGWDYVISPPHGGWVDLGMIMKSDDDGHHWRVQLDQEEKRFNGISLSSAHTGYAVGGHEGMHGKIMKMSHAEWSDMQVGLQDEFYGVSTRSSSKAYAVGSHGRIIKTTDGEHWTVQESGTGVTLNGVVATMDDTAWAVGNKATILHTTDEPRTTSISPTSGPVGTLVNVYGYLFGDSRGNSEVLFGNTESSEYFFWSDNQILCRVPALQGGQVPVKVRVGGRGTSNEQIFTVTTPATSITSITPDEGFKGMTAYIRDLAGTGFRPGVTVKLQQGTREIRGRDVRVVSPSKITCSFDLRGANKGWYDVFAINTDGTFGYLPAGFTVIELTVIPIPW